MRPWHAFAGTFFSFSIYLSLVTSAAITIPNLSIYQSSLQNFSTGLTIPPGLIDPRFSFIPRYNENVPLPRNSLLVIAVNTMSTLAMRDFNGQTASFQSAREPGYDDFYITMKVKAPATQVQTSIAVWGLYAAISHMQIADNFVEADFDLTWDGSKVASLRFQTRDIASAQSMVEGQGTQNQSLTLPLYHPPSLDDMTTTLTEQTPEDSINATSIPKDQVFEAYCEYLPDAETLTFEEVLIPIIRVLQSVAAVPKTSLVDSAFETGYSGVDSRMQFGGPTPSGAVQPPYYQYKWIIKGVNAIPFFLLEHGRSAELTVGLVIDDVLWGKGRLVRNY